MKYDKPTLTVFCGKVKLIPSRCPSVSTHANIHIQNALHLPR